MKREAHTTSWVLYVGAIIIGGLLAVVITPALRGGGTTIPRGIVNNLRLLEGAAQIWALDHGYKFPTPVTTNDVLPYIKAWPQSIAGEEYVLRPFPQSPEAHLTHAIGSYRAGTIFRLGTNGGMEIVMQK